ncbi:hypothetical protein ISCGN_023178 [Ixodes scapularis]
MQFRSATEREQDVTGGTSTNRCQSQVPKHKSMPQSANRARLLHAQPPPPPEACKVQTSCPLPERQQHSEIHNDTEGVAVCLTVVATFCQPGDFLEGRETTGYPRDPRE